MDVENLHWQNHHMRLPWRRLWRVFLYLLKIHGQTQIDVEKHSLKTMLHVNTM